MSARSWCLLLLSALLQIVLSPKPNLFFLSWIAFVPWLIVLYRRPASRRAWLQDVLGGWAVGALWFCGVCHWIYHAMRTHGDLGVAASLFVLLLFCLYLGLYHALFAGLVSWLRIRRVPLQWTVLATPFLWTAVELARSRVTAFPWELLGYTQVDNLPLTRIATFTGVFGLSFIVMLVNAVIASAFAQPHGALTPGVPTLGAPAPPRAIPAQREGWSPATVIIGLLAAASLQAGILWREPASPTDHLAALVQQDFPLEMTNRWTPTYFDQRMAELAQTSEPQELRAQPGTRMIVWPESPAPFFSADARFDRWTGALAEDADAWVIAGAVGTASGTVPTGAEGQIIYNSAALFSPAGRLTARYDKVHLVPFGEYVPFLEYFRFASSFTMDVGAFTGGSRRRLLEAGDIRAGTFICYESIFPDEVRLFAKSGANVLVNISNDGWFGDSGAPGQHLQMARMRAIENGRWLLRATNNAITAVVDPLGREVESAPVNVRYTLLAHYALIAGGQTFYTVHGDWFAYGCALLTLLTPGAMCISRKGRPSPMEPSTGGTGAAARPYSREEKSS